MKELDPNDFIISRKRKKYKFAVFHNSSLCLEFDEWQSDFKPSALEVGAGTGTFSVALAETYPERRHLAVDVKADRLQTGARQATEKNLNNIRFLRARIEQLSDLLQSHSLDIIWINFPDPFAKERSSKHRLTDPRYLTLYKELLKPTGTLHFKTDAVALFDWSLEQLASEGWELRNISFDLHRSGVNDEAKIPTTYEARYVREGKKICYVEAVPPRV